MEPSDIKSWKEQLRHIEDHLRSAHDHLGVQRDAIGFVEVVHHPTYISPTLNYVTPRRRMALVPGKHVETGIEALKKHRRDVHVMYIKELYPPFFGEAVLDIGLSLMDRYPLWIVELPEEPSVYQLPSSLSVTTVVNQQGLEIWKLIWRDGNYKVYNTSLEPLQIANLHQQDNLYDVILYHHSIPIAVARLTIHNDVAHLMAYAILESSLHYPVYQRLMEVTADFAYQQEIEFMFICDPQIKNLPSESNLACQHIGNVLCYSDNFDDTQGEKPYDPMEQPIL